MLFPLLKGRYWLRKARGKDRRCMNPHQKIDLQADYVTEFLEREVEKCL